MGAFEENFRARVQGYFAVAFDVFDTLICRDMGYPTDLFAWMEQQGLAPAGFEARRLQAEQAARSRHPHAEVTMDEIYRPLELNQTVECEAELTLCRPNLPGQRLYEYCRAQGKAIYIISDMYLSDNAVAAMLKKCGYQGWAGLYVSSGFGVQKRSGRLFKLFLRQEKLKPGQVLFVGDNPRADGVGAALAGIRCCLLPQQRPTLYTNVKIGAAARAAATFAQNRTGDKTRPYQLGYGVVGPLLYSFCLWLKRMSAEKQRSKLLFLARDMYLTQKMYAHLAPACQAAYLRVSRRSICAAVLALTPFAENEALFLDLLPRQILSKKELADYCGVPAALLPMQSDTVDCKTRPYTAQAQTFAKAMHFLYGAKEGETLRENAMQTLSYLQQQIPDTDDAMLVDIGSGGTIQRAIEAILNRPLVGCYLACDSRLREFLPRARAEVCLFGAQPLQATYRAGQPLLELLISEQCGATLGYTGQNGVAVPQIAQGFVPQPIITQIQAAALDFAAQWQASPLAAWPLEPDEEIQQWLGLVQCPAMEDVTVLGGLLAEDGGRWPLALPRSKAYYTLHPNALRQDFAAARWKTGFLTRLLPLGLPYGKWYEKLRK